MLAEMMKKRTKLVLGIGIGLFSLLFGAAVTFYFWAWVPGKRFSDPVWWESASQTERADLCHILIDRNLDGHDVWLHLRHVGNKASIPRLLKQFEDAGAILEDGGWCVADHCLDALRSITGHDAGKTPGAWRSWWEETGSKLPEDQFHPRAANQKVDGIPHSARSAP
jgi:hypothetical protein